MCRATRHSPAPGNVGHDSCPLVMHIARRMSACSFLLHLRILNSAMNTDSMRVGVAGIVMTYTELCILRSAEGGGCSRHAYIYASVCC